MDDCINIFTSIIKSKFQRLFYSFSDQNIKKFTYKDKYQILKWRITYFRANNQVFTFSNNYINIDLTQEIPNVIRMKQQPILRTQEQKPVNISISFNINPKNITNQINSVGGWQDPSIKGKKIHLENNLNIKNTLFQASKTPDLSYTDRNAYSKEIQCLKPMQEAKKYKKRKRKSMDYDLDPYSRNQTHQKIKQNDKSTKIEGKYQSVPFGRTVSKSDNKSNNRTSIYQTKNNKIGTDGNIKNKPQSSQKTGLDINALKLLTNDNIKSQRKVNINSLKSLISKLINNQISKKSLPLQPLSRLKHIPGPGKRKTPLKKTRNEKTLVGTTLPKGQKKQFFKHLNSLNSMATSVLQSQAEQQIKYYEKAVQQQVFIKTQQSNDLVSEIHLYENMKRQMIIQNNDNPIDKMKNTQMIIEAVMEVFNSQSELEINLMDQNQRNTKIPNIFIEQNQIINTVIQYEKTEDKIVQPQQVRQINQERQLQEFKKKREQIRPFLSSEMHREQTLVKQLERLKLNQLKKQQIQKWAYLLSYIKQKMNNKANTQQILNSVYDFLERQKIDLQHDIASSDFKLSEHRGQDKRDLASFTVKLSSKNDEKIVRNVEYQQSMEQVQSFKQQYSQQNEDWRSVNLQTIQQALKNRYNQLMERKVKQIHSLETKKQSGKLTDQQFDKQVEKIQKWIKNQINQITKAKKNIWKGFNEAKNILYKDKCHQLESSKKKSMMRCLSDNYLLRSDKKVIEKLKKTNQQYKVQKDRQYQQEQNKQSQQDQQDKQDQQDQESSDKQMDRIKQRLISMKKQHFQGDYEEDDQNYNDNQPVSDYQEPNYNSANYQQIQQDFKKSIEHQDDDLKQEINISKKLMQVPIIKNPFKCLIEEDKEDIFQFIFLDLCIQLYQEPAKDNRIMKSINKHISNVKNNSKKRKGVKTSLTVVKQYLKRFIGYVLRTNKNALQNLNTAMGPTALQMLKYMHENQDQVPQEETSTVLIVPIEIFDQFQKTLMVTIQFEKIYEDQQRQLNRVQFLKNVLHIHNKALFDGMNEFLDKKRPFGIWGKPFPWKKTPSFFHPLSLKEQQQILKQSGEKVAQYCAYVCGLLVDKQDSLVGNAKISDDYLQSIKQDRLSRMLANDLIENQQRWVFFDDQQTEVLVEVSNFVWSSIIKQIMAQVYQLQGKQRK